jgi:hypothetical protein
VLRYFNPVGAHAVRIGEDQSVQPDAVRHADGDWQTVFLNVYGSDYATPTAPACATISMCRTWPKELWLLLATQKASPINLERAVQQRAGSGQRV